MSKPDECIHGYPTVHRRHCRDCQFAELTKENQHHESRMKHFESLALQNAMKCDELQEKIERLRAAAQNLHETINTYLQGDCDKSAVIKTQSQLASLLSTEGE